MDSILPDFLEAAVAASVAARGLYPPEAFQRVKLFNCGVLRCRHPGVARYVAETVERLKVGGQGLDLG
jgi:hypothetical protein